MVKTLCSDCGREKGVENECVCGSYLYACSGDLKFEDETIKCGCGSLDFETVNETKMNDISIMTCYCNDCGNTIYFETYQEEDEIGAVHPDKLSLIRPKDGEVFQFDDITIDKETNKISYLAIHAKPDDTGLMERYRYDFEKQHWREMFHLTFGVEIEELERMFKIVGLMEE